MRSLRPNQLHGSFAPLITPFSDGAVDYDTFIELVDWMQRRAATASSSAPTRSRSRRR